VRAVAPGGRSEALGIKAGWKLVKLDGKFVDGADDTLKSAEAAQEYVTAACAALPARK